MNSPLRIKGFKSPRSRRNRNRTRTVKTPNKTLNRVIESVHEETKNESDDQSQNDSTRNPIFRRSNNNVKGILALTKDNLKKLDLKNQVNFSSTYVIETEL
jgi:hypothetical protein